MRSVLVDALGFLTPLHRLVAAVMAVATHQDVDLGPMPADQSIKNILAGEAKNIKSSVAVCEKPTRETHSGIDAR